MFKVIRPNNILSRPSLLVTRNPCSQPSTCGTSGAFKQPLRPPGRSISSSASNHHDATGQRLKPFSLLAYFSAGTVVTGLAVWWWSPVANAEAPVALEATRFIRLAEVKKHGRLSDRKWVTKGTRVFDITDWIAAHPGGAVILSAVGGSIDKYWDIFSIHKKQDVYDILDGYCIGEIDPKDLTDGKVTTEVVDDPFVSDPRRDPLLLEHTSQPCNAETPTSCLGSFITPNETFYVRNHFWVPRSNEGSHLLTVELPDGTEKEYTISDLKAKFTPFHMTATLQCSGNRRKHMSEAAEHATGLQWDVGAISNAEWTGVRLRDVLADAGFPVNDWTSEGEEAHHVQFVGAEAYGASIPMHKALDPLGDVMLAYEMGGKPLPRDHGYPLRALVPGHTAARSVKWLEKIVLAEDESQAQWQQRDYKCFGPNQSAKDVDWTSAPAIQETPVQSAITSMRSISAQTTEGQKELQTYGLEDDAIKVEGYALSGGGRKIVRVDFSADGGRHWQQAAILPDESKGRRSWSWKRWEIAVPKHTAGKDFVVKAVDESYNNQPESYEAQYNFRGNLTNAWHRVQYPDKDQS